MEKNSKEWLAENGYDGLYCPGECACTIKDFAPCGDDDYRDECFPGYKHLDPRPEHREFGDFALSGSKEPMTDEEWAEISYN